jgi:hypothetical protein
MHSRLDMCRIVDVHLPYVLETANALNSERACAGWEDTRLLAPMAEVTLHLVAAPGILETNRLAALGLALRGLLCLEVRKARVAASYAMPDTPQHILPTTTCRRMVVQTVSGPQFPVIIGAPAQVSTLCTSTVSLLYCTV